MSSEHDSDVKARTTITMYPPSMSIATCSRGDHLSCPFPSSLVAGITSLLTAESSLSVRQRRLLRDGEDMLFSRPLGRLLSPTDILIYQQVLHLRLLSITLHLEPDQHLHRLPHPPALPDSPLRSPPPGKFRVGSMYAAREGHVRV